MSTLTLASVNATLGSPLSPQWAHDIRNALAVSALHLETLERLSGPKGRKAANAALAVMNRVASMCAVSLADAARPEHGAQRRSFDLIKTIREIVAILQPMAPAGFKIHTPLISSCMVLADPGDVYRIIFNLVHNAIAIARNGGAMSHIGIDITRTGPTVAVLIVDDGPGLPPSVRAAMFRRRNGTTTGSHGLGLVIARELTERNGSTLRLTDPAKGTGYVFELTGVYAIVGAAEGS